MFEYCRVDCYDDNNSIDFFICLAHIQVNCLIFDLISGGTALQRARVMIENSG